MTFLQKESSFKPPLTPHCTVYNKMSDSQAQWLYYDASKVQKGPIPLNVMHRLLEKGIGVSPDTLVWRAGMESWQKMAEVEEFREICSFLSKSWFYLDHANNQKGPVMSRFILHKMQEGDIDGLSMVYCEGMKEWTRVSDVPELRIAFQKIADEESRASAVLSSVNPEEQTFSSDMYKDEVIPCFPLGKQEDEEDSIKEFTNDKGIKHVWDKESEEWVVADQDEDEIANETSQFFQEIANDNTDELGESDSNHHEREKKKKNKKKKKKTDSWKPTSNLWVYVSNLPLDITLEEIKSHFSKVGLIALNPTDQLPKIKLYLDDHGQPKGDCSICYNAESSAQMALDVLDGGYIRPSTKPISVSKAEFRKRPASENDSAAPQKRQCLTSAQIKVSKNAMAQALAWNEDDDVGISKAKALKIVVLENMFDPLEIDAQMEKSGLNDDTAFFENLEKDIASECQKCGPVEKITAYSRSPQGAVIIKYYTSFAAQECVKIFDGRMYAGRKVRCKFWDGVTDYSAMSVPTLEDRRRQREAEKTGNVKIKDAEEARLDEFGDWLDNEQDDLPEEFRLRVE